ncbi:MAG: hypothetical protein D4R69_02065 [Actinomycetales bacterium]|nr:MAG: hypothetical protein D4R69_02065 [Actinomycetales bacterium]
MLRAAWDGVPAAFTAADTARARRAWDFSCDVFIPGTVPRPSVSAYEFFGSQNGLPTHLWENLSDFSVLLRVERLSFWLCQLNQLEKEQRDTFGCQ